MSWQTYLQEAVKTRITCSTLAAFNANIDIVVHIQPQHVAQIFQEKLQLPASNQPVPVISTKEEFLTLLKDCLGQGKSSYEVVNTSLIPWFNRVFSDQRKAMGGQAGIIANQMAALEGKAYVYNPVLSSEQVQIYDERVKYPLVDGGVRWIPIRQAVNDTFTKVNYIFEYPKGETYDFGGLLVTTPRANRIILGTRNPKAAMGFDAEIEPYLAEVGASINLGFMAGYHHGMISGRAETLEEYITLSLRQRRALSEKNSTLKLHYEYVPMKVVEDEKKLLSSLVPEFHSFGINENEIKKVLWEFGHDNLAQEISWAERAYSLYQGTLALSNVFQVPRIQLHNLGYYILVIRKPYPVAPELVRQACLFASAVNGIKARDGGAVPLSKVGQMADYPLSEIGFTQLREFAREGREEGLPIPDNFEETGIMEHDDHYLLLVPAHVVPSPVSTVGMGDTVSSAAYSAELSLGGCC